MIWISPPATTAKKTSRVNGRALSSSFSYQPPQALLRDGTRAKAAIRQATAPDDAGGADEVGAEHPHRAEADGEEPEEGRGAEERPGQAELAVRRGLLVVNLDGAVDRRRALHGAIEVVNEEEPAGEIEPAADDPHQHHRPDGIERVEEVGVREEGAVLGGGVEHQALRDAAGPHGGDVEEDADGPDPEVEVGQGGRVQRLVPEAREQPVDQTGGHEAVPAQGAGMDVSDDPVGVMREGIDRLDGEERALEGGHAVERDGGGVELEDGIGAQLVPGAAEGEQAVEHAAPRRGPEHEGERHAEVLQPAGQGGVKQMVRAGPDVDENEGPEMHDRQPVAVHRAFRRLRQEVVHDAEDRRGEEERHGVVSVPPLDQRVLHAAEHRVAVQQAGRDREVVDDVEHRNGHDGRDVEPDRDVERGFAAAGERPEEVHREDDPDEHHHQVDGPDQLGVFLAAGETEREGDRGADDDELPAPEVQRGEEVTCEAGFDQPLGGVIDAGEHHVADEGEDDGVGVQRAQTAERQPRRGEVQLPEVELGRDEDAHQHPDRAPDDGGEEELADDAVVIFDRDFLAGHGGRDQEEEVEVGRVRQPWQGTFRPERQPQSLPWDP